MMTPRDWRDLGNVLMGGAIAAAQDPYLQRALSVMAERCRHTARVREQEAPAANVPRCPHCGRNS